MPDLLPTQDVNEIDTLDGSTNEQTDEENVWGRLFSLNKKFPSIDLTSEEYTFGRGEDCDISFDAFANISYWNALSKKHFQIVLTQSKHNPSGKDAFLHDLSSNGTFLNGIKVGRNKQQLLQNNDEIALAAQQNKVFVFLDAKALECSSSNFFHSQISSKYVVSKKLGSGACGEVMLVFDRQTGAPYALKVIQKKVFQMPRNTSLTVQNEVAILQKLHHPCIIKVHEAFDTDSALYIVLELVDGGELFDRIVEKNYLPDFEAKLIFFQMVLAIKYLHDNGIAHRDLKPENILLSSSVSNGGAVRPKSTRATSNAPAALATSPGAASSSAAATPSASSKYPIVKITDFGLSKFVGSQTMLKTFCGTPNYLAPEVLQSAGAASYTNAVDVWALGVILYICLAGYPPFSDERTDYTLKEQIEGGHYEFHAQHWRHVKPEAVDLVRRMLTVDVAQRISLDAVLRHAWLRNDAAVLRNEARSLLGDETVPDEQQQEEEHECEVEQPDLEVEKARGEELGVERCSMELSKSSSGDTNDMFQQTAPPQCSSSVLHHSTSSSSASFTLEMRLGMAAMMMTSSVSSKFAKADPPRKRKQDSSDEMQLDAQQNKSLVAQSIQENPKIDACETERMDCAINAKRKK